MLIRRNRGDPHAGFRLSGKTGRSCLGGSRIAAAFVAGKVRGAFRLEVRFTSGMTRLATEVVLVTVRGGSRRVIAPGAMACMRARSAGEFQGGMAKRF